VAGVKARPQRAASGRLIAGSRASSATVAEVVEVVGERRHGCVETFQPPGTARMLSDVIATPVGDFNLWDGH